MTISFWALPAVQVLLTAPQMILMAAAVTLTLYMRLITPTMKMLLSQRSLLKVHKLNWVCKSACIRVLLLISYSQAILKKIGHHQSMFSSVTHPISNMLISVESMSLCVQPPTVRRSMGVMYDASLIQAMQGQPAAYIDMWRCAGVKKQSVLQTTPKIWMVHAPSWPSPDWREIKVSLRHLSALIRKKWPIHIVSIYTQRWESKLSTGLWRTNALSQLWMIVASKTWWRLDISSIDCLCLRLLPGMWSMCLSACDCKYLTS